MKKNLFKSQLYLLAIKIGEQDAWLLSFSSDSLCISEDKAFWFLVP
jgi:hypothetical protein